MIILKVLKKLYSRIMGKGASMRNWTAFSNKEYSNTLITDLLKSDKPCMISRIGSTELLCLKNYISVKSESQKSSIEYIKGNRGAWWWEKSILQQMKNWSGFFPSTEENLEKFSQLMIQDLSSIDLLGSWLIDEEIFAEELKQADRVILEDLEPFFTNQPWTWALEGKKVLVVHPFEEEIKNQFDKRKDIFTNELLPDFELITLKAVQSLGGDNDSFSSWFDALEFMKEQISAVDFDVCIIGCGAYGLPLAAHVKRIGKKAVHLGGVTQLLFGIKGKRWENYIVWPYMNLFNEHWIRPGEANKPNSSDKVEENCYW
ncbi:hypothetical protein [Aliiglaciecola lipolytica]|uniref:hypothetical protein n=1 Tax=Aliiglaciecola lipolytica TaxID=477689 RepID=UPI001C08A891|nr:hypothetical protein [Aliiglaciecola lipolytica]MBU2880311.1 hypothetical protein [Aliiglaciecola lipolytica]